MWQGLRRRGPAAALALCALGVLPGCDEGSNVPVPGSDSTPPELKIGSAGLDPDLFVKTGGFEGDDHPTVTSAESPRTKSGLVLATAQDSESGIQSVTLGGALTRTCEQPNGDLGQQQVEELQIPQTSPPENTRPQRLATQFSIDPEMVRRCRSGFRFTGARLTLEADARNGVGGTSRTAGVTVRITP